MRILFPLLLVMLITIMIGVMVKACNQEMYDKIYAAICIDSMRHKRDDREEEMLMLKQRQLNIQALRVLCEGQLSSYEKGKRK